MQILLEVCSIRRNLVFYIVTEKEFEDITHSWDIWHGAKNLGKKISAVRNVKTG